MKRSLLAIGLVLFASLAASAATLLKVTYAQSIDGQAVVIGKAAPGAAIYWEGSKVTTAVSSGLLAGYFAFSGIMPIASDRCPPADSPVTTIRFTSML